MASWKATNIGKGTVDVVGLGKDFAGNIALKTAEGTARQIGEYLRAAIEPNPDGPHRLRLSPGARSTACGRRWIVRKANGGVFLGLNGIVVKKPWRYGCRRFLPRSPSSSGYDMVRAGLLEGNQPEMARYHGREAGPFTPGARRGEDGEQGLGTNDQVV